MSNLYDFDPEKDRVPYEQLPELDRWALLKLKRTDSDVSRQSYEDFEFHAIFHALNNFCSVDLSADYLDILKDRLYTFRADSPFRRRSQTVLFDIVSCYDEAHGPGTELYGRRDLADLGGELKAPVMPVCIWSSFPEVNPKWHDSELAQRWEELLDVRVVRCKRGWKSKRREKLIGPPLEAQCAARRKSRRYEFLKP